MPVTPAASEYRIGHGPESTAKAAGDDSTAIPAATRTHNAVETRPEPSLDPTGGDSIAGASARYAAGRLTDSGASPDPRASATLGPGPEMTRTSPTFPAGAGGQVAGAATGDPPQQLAWGASRGNVPGTYPSTTDASGRSLAAPTVAPPVATPFATGTPDLTSNVPGDRALEGQQSPAIVIEKTAPDEIQVERQATFQIRVRNVGNCDGAQRGRRGSGSPRHRVRRCRARMHAHARRNRWCGTCRRCRPTRR